VRNSSPAAAPETPGEPVPPSVAATLGLTPLLLNNALHFTDKVAGIWRAKVFWDPYGLATGSPNELREMTLGLNIQPKPWLWLRPEARYDWAQFTRPYNDGTRNSQFTIGFDVIVLF